jgi:hypothetical protein
MPKAVAAERGGVQFVFRRDDNLADIDSRRRLAARRDPSLPIR